LETIVSILKQESRGEGTVGHVDVATTGDATVPIRKKVTRMTQPSVTE